MSNFEIQMKVALSEDFHNLYPVTKAEQIITNSGQRFITDSEKALLTVLSEINYFDLLMNMRNTQTLVEIIGETLRETITNNITAKTIAVRLTETSGNITTENTTFYASDGVTAERIFTRTCAENSDASYTYSIN